jgi:hypothetical protein
MAKSVGFVDVDVIGQPKELQNINLQDTDIGQPRKWKNLL